MKAGILHALALTAALLCSACVTGSRLEAPPASASPPGFDASIRADPMNRDAYAAYVSAWGARAAAAADGAFDVLSISGGGAGGAYGAGVLIGMSQAHDRPQFEIVTGVSTGALIAPAVFLGSDYDHVLDAAYSESAGRLLRPLGIGALFSTSVYDGRPLRNLVNRFITDDLIDAVARASESGRLLVVATTDLDRGETMIWNMSAIAAKGGDAAHRLFRDVMVASASVPGVFPPVMIRVSDGKQTFEEMHADGGASLPFFVSPDLLTTSEAPAALRGANIYVIVNGQLAPTVHTTALNTAAITGSAFSTVLMHYARASLVEADAFARRNGMSLHFTAIPAEYPDAGSLNISQHALAALFGYGKRCALAGQVWLDVGAAIERAQRTVTPAATAEIAPCLSSN